MIDIPGEEEDKQVENVFDESLTEKFTNLKKENNQSTEPSKLDESKQTHAKSKLCMFYSPPPTYVFGIIFYTSCLSLY